LLIFKEDILEKCRVFDFKEYCKLKALDINVHCDLFLQSLLLAHILKH